MAKGWAGGSWVFTAVVTIQETELEQLRRLLGSVERENATLADELDSVLMENAQLRQRIDGADGDGGGAGGAGDGGGSSEDAAAAAAENAALYGTRVGIGGRRRGGGFYGLGGTSGGGRRGLGTCGVHTTRLRRAAFEGWRAAIIEVSVGDGMRSDFRMSERWSCPFVNISCR